jgi:putative transposase
VFGCQQILLKPDKELKAVLEYICQESNKLHNCAVYYARQIYFKAHIYVRPFEVINALKHNPHYGALCAQAAQQTCGAVGEIFQRINQIISGRQA